MKYQVVAEIKGTMRAFDLKDDSLAGAEKFLAEMQEFFLRLHKEHGADLPTLYIRPFHMIS